MRRFLLILMLVPVFACAPPKSGVVRFARGLRLAPLTMTDATPAQALSMRLEINRDGVPFRFDAFAEQEPGRLALVGMTPLGTTGFSATWQTGVFEYEHLPFYKLPIPPQELLLDYQFIYLPDSLLIAELQKHEITLEKTGTLRRFQHRGRTLVEIHYKGQGRTIHLKHVTHGYTLLVNTREVEDLTQ